ncbi:hypothetical protein ABMA32_01800 [Mesorhizobium sp. VNQ89]|uniref:YciI family protein n=1 Tax=Mesorhizobium quangtriensis TaxID=3157709 RepID=UPI0032B82ABE
MPRYLVAIHRPDDYDGAVEGHAMARDIDALNEEMIAAGVRLFVCGLQPPQKAVSLRRQPYGEVLISNGPYLPGGEHVGGFWILETATIDEATEWGRKAAIACRASVDVRPLH